MGKRVFSSTLLWSIVIATLWFLRADGVVLLAAALHRIWRRNEGHANVSATAGCAASAAPFALSRFV